MRLAVCDALGSATGSRDGSKCTRMLQQLPRVLLTEEAGLDRYAEILSEVRGQASGAGRFSKKARW